MIQVINNVDAQFAYAQAEISNLMKFMEPNSTAGGHALEALQGMRDALDAIQMDILDDGSYTHVVMSQEEDEKLGQQ